MLAEAERKAACMKMLADQYRQAKAGCVDMEKVKACVNGPAVSGIVKPSKAGGVAGSTLRRM